MLFVFPLWKQLSFYFLFPFFEYSSSFPCHCSSAGHLMCNLMRKIVNSCLCLEVNYTYAIGWERVVSGPAALPTPPACQKGGTSSPIVEFNWERIYILTRFQNAIIPHYSLRNNSLRLSSGAFSTYKASVSTICWLIC